MSYAVSPALQEAIYTQLNADAGLVALVGASIYDAPPVGDKPDLYVTLGEEEVRDVSDVTGHGAEHRFRLLIVTEQAGYAKAKEVAAAICDALEDADLSLSRGRLVRLLFDRAIARKTGKAGRARQIEMRFRARVEDS